MSKLYIIGSPIGNLEDITIRAIGILKNLDYVFSEDTRISSKLMKNFDISTLLIPIYTSKKELTLDKKSTIESSKENDDLYKDLEDLFIWINL